MPQGPTDMRNILRDVSEKKKFVLEYLKLSHNFHGSIGERFVKTE